MLNELEDWRYHSRPFFLRFPAVYLTVLFLNNANVEDKNEQVVQLAEVDWSILHIITNNYVQW